MSGWPKAASIGPGLNYVVIFGGWYYGQSDKQGTKYNIRFCTGYVVEEKINEKNGNFILELIFRNRQTCHRFSFFAVTYI